jgi:nicotinate-nucleotide pyrophosphorylase (carboxylating)
MDPSLADRYDEVARVALAEDAPDGDVTTRAAIPAGTVCSAELKVKQPGVIAGLDAATAVFRIAADQDRTTVTVDAKVADGEEVRPGDRLALIHGDAATILRAERPAVNLLSHLSGVATLTRAFVRAAAPAAVLCTRKTLPGLRALERAAVASGGGTLHRASLSDAILIKDNHVQIAGGVAQAIRRAATSGLPIEVEVETLEQLDEALAEGADRILLDNPTPDLVRAAIARLGGSERLEVSGGVTLQTVDAFVAAGARAVSVGRLTHSAPAVDISLDVTDVLG